MGVFNSIYVFFLVGPYHLSAKFSSKKKREEGAKRYLVANKDGRPFWEVSIVIGIR